MKLLSMTGRGLIVALLAVVTSSCEKGDNTNWVDVGGYFASARVAGSRHDIATTGRYRFVISDGAYKFSESSAGWRSEMWVYRNRPVQWYEVTANPPAVNPDAKVGDPTDRATREEAVASGLGESVSFDLNAGEYLLFTVPDNRGLFGDNPGGISFAVQMAE